LFEPASADAATLVRIAPRPSSRAERSHQPNQVREQGGRRFKSTHQAQRLPGIHSAVCNLFNLGRQSVSAKHHRLFRQNGFAPWECATGASSASFPGFARDQWLICQYRPEGVVLPQPKNPALQSVIYYEAFRGIPAANTAVGAGPGLV
jgi:hypothetical protein